MTSILIYCPNPTPRHDYIFELFFRMLLGVDYSYTPNVNEAMVNYSHEKNESFHIVPYGLLDEFSIRTDILDEISFETSKMITAFFKTVGGSCQFDLFSAAFFLVSRYEEYLPFSLDNHRRFPAEASVLFKNNMLEEPLINQWAIFIRQELTTNFEISFPKKKFTYLSTIDIDQAWKYKYKGIIRNTLGLVRNVIRVNISEIRERIKVFLGIISDPYFNFKWQNEFHLSLKTQVIYFILLGKYGSYDKNIKPSNPHFISLIKDLDSLSYARLGIHPSYVSNSNPIQLSKEYQNLNTIISGSITMSRQHYLIHAMPYTYRQLIKLGIKEDFTLGYSTHIGFRAGIASSFYWFDLIENIKTDLLLTPFCIMDITPMYYRSETPEIAKKTIESLLNKVQAVDGMFVSLWHNESLSETDRWKGWRSVYVHLNKLANGIIFSE